MPVAAALDMAARAEPPWRVSRPPALARLRRDVEVDVGVVGAGIAGLSVAYFCARAGLKVAVFEAAPFGRGMTAATTGHLSTAIDARYFRIESAHGREAARLVADSHQQAIAAIRAVVERERIDCALESLPGYLFEPPAGDGSILERERRAARRAGLAVRLRPSLPWAKIAGLEFPEQAQFHPLRYLAGLVRALAKYGDRVYRARVDEVENGEPLRLRLGERVARCKAVVVATNAPVNDRLAVHVLQAPYITYAIGLRVAAGSAPRYLAWDTEEPYHYVRRQPMRAAGRALPGWAGDELLIVGGEDHPTGRQTRRDPHRRLEIWARRRFPEARQVAFRWGGQVMESHDGLALIGRNPLDDPNVYVVSGDSGMGLTHGTIAGLLLAELVRGRSHPWTEVYDPGRLRVAAAPGLVRQGLDAARSYARRVRSGAGRSASDIPRRGGAVLARGGKVVAAYRDEHGALHEHSAVCPHLGCVVSWNGVEKSWDCPCHGSRFTPEGRVFNGPANQDLEAPSQPDHGAA